MHEPQFPYSFFSCWTFKLFPFLVIANRMITNMAYQKLFSQKTDLVLGVSSKRLQICVMEDLISVFQEFYSLFLFHCKFYFAVVDFCFCSLLKLIRTYFLCLGSLACTESLSHASVDRVVVMCPLPQETSISLKQ